MSPPFASFASFAPFAHLHDPAGPRAIAALAFTWAAVAASLFSPVTSLRAAESASETKLAIDGAITAAGLAGAGLFTVVPVDTEHTWSRELLPFDESVKDNFSNNAAAKSDILVSTVILLPMAAQLPGGLNEAVGRRLLIYGEALSVTVLVNSAAKVIVQRPRPYTYSLDPQIRAYAKDQGADSRLSFYSGHAAMSFAAAVAGSYLFATTTTDTRSRATFWGVELALAAATANLRVRAGKHFYSDVIVGAIAGVAAGILVPYVHQSRGEGYEPTVEEWAAMGGGLVVGAAVSQLLPFRRDIAEPLASGSSAPPVALAPLILEGGAGLQLALTL